MTPRIPKDTDRMQRMADLYRSGNTLQEIGTEYGVTRERVRQLIGFLGMNRNSGGQSVRAIGRARERHTELRDRKEARFIAHMGCPKAAFIELTGIDWSPALHRKGSAKTNPGIAYFNQKRTALIRNIGWELTFPAWWRIWQESGKWDQRGRGTGYCMARHGDSGPYSVENVYICTIGQNFSDSYLVHPWAERFAGISHGGTPKRDELGMTPQVRSVWDARKAGATFNAIARQLGVKRKTAETYYYRALAIHHA